MICVVTRVLIGLQTWVVCCNGLLCRTSRGKSLLHTGYKLVVSVSRQPQVQPHAIKPNPRKPDAKAEHAHAQWPWMCCENTRASTARHHRDVTWAHGPTTDLGQSGSSAGWQGEKSGFNSHTPPQIFKPDRLI